eukprot:4543276-Prymnesium_polylepis.1
MHSSSNTQYVTNSALERARSAKALKAREQSMPLVTPVPSRVAGAFTPVSPEEMSHRLNPDLEGSPDADEDVRSWRSASSASNDSRSRCSPTNEPNSRRSSVGAMLGAVGIGSSRRSCRAEEEAARARQAVEELE